MDTEKIIFVADRSYTIRRIIEMAFSEKGNVQIHLFENGKELKNAIIQNPPDALILDIKLPDISGYEICRFINEQSFPKKIKIFLLKGSFEPIENETIKSLKFEELITKPFDSSALISTVMKSLEEESPVETIAEEIPSSLPEEEFTEIETSHPESEISFASLKDELEKLEIDQQPIKEEIQPSEEITVGSQPSADNLAPEGDVEQNPFSEESIAPPTEEQLAIEETIQPEESEEKSQLESEENFAQISMEETSESSESSQLDLFQKEELEIEKSDVFSEIELKEPAPIEEKVDVPVEETKTSPEVADFFAEENSQQEVEPAPTFEPMERVISTEVEKADTASQISKKILSEEAIAAEISRLSPEIKPHPHLAEKTDFNLADKEELLKKVEDRLTLAIKEILWEIIPALAEKIIRQEIEAIKKEAELP